MSCDLVINGSVLLFKQVNKTCVVHLTETVLCSNVFSNIYFVVHVCYHWYISIGVLKILYLSLVIENLLVLY